MICNLWIPIVSHQLKRWWPNKIMSLQSSSSVELSEIFFQEKKLHKTKTKLSSESSFVVAKHCNWFRNEISSWMKKDKTISSGESNSCLIYHYICQVNLYSLFQPTTLVWASWTELLVRFRLLHYRFVILACQAWYWFPEGHETTIIIPLLNPLPRVLF